MTGAELLRATVNFWGTGAATGLIFTPFAGDGPEEMAQLFMRTHYV